MPSFEPSPPLAPLEPAAALPPAAETGLRFELSFSAVEGGACASFAWASGSVNNGSVGQVLCASLSCAGVVDEINPELPPVPPLAMFLQLKH